MHNTKYKNEWLILFSTIFIFPQQKSKVFWHLLAYLVKQIDILNIGFGFCVFQCIWEHILNVFLTLFRRRRRVPSSRPVVVVRPLSVRPSVLSSVPSSSVLCPSYVRSLSVRPIVRLKLLTNNIGQLTPTVLRKENKKAPPYIYIYIYIRILGSPKAGNKHERKTPVLMKGYLKNIDVWNKMNFGKVF